MKIWAVIEYLQYAKRSVPEVIFLQVAEFSG